MKSFFSVNARMGELEFCDVFRGDRPLPFVSDGVKAMFWLDIDSGNGGRGKPWWPEVSGSSKIWSGAARRVAAIV